MNPLHTRRQVPRATRADAEVGSTIYLLKKVPRLHATYQVRLLAYRALQEGKKLVIRVPKHFTPEPSLAQMLSADESVVSIERGHE